MCIVISLTGSCLIIYKAVDTIKGKIQENSNTTLPALKNSTTTVEKDSVTAWGKLRRHVIKSL